jgi:hypothetical protein
MKNWNKKEFKSFQIVQKKVSSLYAPHTIFGILLFLCKGHYICVFLGFCRRHLEFVRFLGWERHLPTPDSRIQNWLLLDLRSIKYLKSQFRLKNTIQLTKFLNLRRQYTVRRKFSGSDSKNLQKSIVKA